MPKPDSDVLLFDAMYECRSMRRLKPDPVPEEVLVQLVDAGMHAPSSSNGQNWRFVVVRDRAVKTQIAAIWRKGWGVYTDTVLQAGPRPHEDAAAQARNLKASNYMIDHLEDVPAFVCIAIKKDAHVAKAVASPAALKSVFKHFGAAGFKTLAGSGRVGALGTAATAYPAAQNVLLAARALGLGAVLTTPHFFCPGEMEQVLALPSDVSLLAIIPVGYPLGNFGPVRRPPPERAISWDRYTEPPA